MKKIKILILIGMTPLLLFGLNGCDSSNVDGGCCKVCASGKACGDSCIAANKNCNQGAGCACYG